MLNLGTPASIKYILPYHKGIRTGIGLYYINKLSNKAKLKLHVYELYKHKGIPASNIAIMLWVSKATVYRWIKQVIQAKKIRRYQFLEPKPKIPKYKPRKTRLTNNIKYKILEIRKQCKCGKDKIKVYLKQYYGITLGATTIHRFLQSIPKDMDPLYKYKIASSKAYKRKKKSRIKKIRPYHIKDKLKHKPFELIQLDVLEYKSFNRKYYIYSAIDINTRYAIAYAYTRHNSRNAKDFLIRLELAFNLHKAKASNTTLYLQSDNGQEFMGEFRKYALQKGYTLVNSRARKPQENGYVERFNGILERELLDYTVVSNIQELNSKLLDYIKYYNYTRIHTSLQYKTPIEKLIAQLENNQTASHDIIANSLSHLLWTWTLTCI